MSGSRLKPRTVKVTLELSTSLPLLTVQDKHAWQEAMQMCSTLFHIENEILSVKATGNYPKRSKERHCPDCRVLYAKDDPNGKRHSCIS
jgi:hypothetical protein